MIKNKNFCVSIKNKQTFIYEKESFGWKLINEKPLKNGKISLTFNFDKNINKAKTLRKMEKDYRKLNAKFPLFTLISNLLSIISLILYIIFIRQSFCYYFLLALVLFICVFIYSLFNFIFLKASPYIKKELLNEARIIVGNTLNVPLANNVKKINQNSNLIRKSIWVNK